MKMKATEQNSWNATKAVLRGKFIALMLKFEMRKC